MNADRNGKQNTESTQNAELTAFALDQLDETETNKVQERVAGDADAQVVVAETRRVANLIERTADHDVPMGIPGLENRIVETLDQPDLESELSLKDKVDSTRKQKYREGHRVLAIVATLLLAAGGAYWFLQADMPREVATNHADSSSIPGRLDTTSGDDGDQASPSVNVLDVNQENKEFNLGPVFSVDSAEEESLSLEFLDKEEVQYSERSLASGQSKEHWRSEEGQQQTNESGRVANDVPGGSSSRNAPLSEKDENVFDDLSEAVVDESKPQGGRVVGRRENDSLQVDGVTVPLPKMATTTTSGVVNVPDSGTIILGGIKIDRERIGESVVPTPEETALASSFADLTEERTRLTQTRWEMIQQPGDEQVQLQRRQLQQLHTQLLAVVDNPGDPRVLALESAIRNRLATPRFDVDVDNQPTNEQYELPPENRFLQPVGEAARSTFSIDVDTASYANLRRFVTSGRLPPPRSVRIEELVNYFSYDYKQPADDQAFTVNMEVAGCPWDTSHRLMRIGIKGKEVARDDRPPSNLVFLIDVSGSMSDSSKLPLLQRSMLLLVDRLTENDRVTIVTYAGNAGLRLEPTSGDQKQKIRDVISGLASGGSTHGSAGIQMAYNLASEHFIDEGVNRVILATDGDLNVGVTADDQLVSLIKDKARLGIFLSVLGFGTGNLKDAKLEKIADNGNGQYSYIDSIQEARKVLVDEMAGSLITIAKDVKIQIEFNPAEIAAYRLIGYENRAMKNEDFDNDGVDAGDIGAGHTVTAFYEIVPTGVLQTQTPVLPAEPLKYQQEVQSEVVDETRPITNFELTEAARTGELMTLSLRYKEPQADDSTRTQYVVYDDDKSFDEASSDFRFAASVASFGMLMRRSHHAGNWNLSNVEQQAAAAAGEDSNGHRSEFVDLVRQTRKLAGH